MAPSFVYNQLDVIPFVLVCRVVTRQSYLDSPSGGPVALPPGLAQMPCPASYYTGAGVQATLRVKAR